MRILTPFAEALGTFAAIALLAACSGGSAIPPLPASPQSVAYSGSGHQRSSFGPMAFLDIRARIAHHFKSFYSCPATGAIKYVSSQNYSVISIYAGPFAGQAPCGMIASTSLSGPAGLFVKLSTHDLYVANTYGNNVLVFHRGQTTPYNTFTDPTGQKVQDVKVATGGILIASNFVGTNAFYGITIAWIDGPNGGTFVGNFPMTGSDFGGFLAVKKDGAVYYNDATNFGGAMWTVRCPAVCAEPDASSGCVILSGRRHGI